MFASEENNDKKKQFLSLCSLASWRQCALNRLITLLRFYDVDPLIRDQAYPDIYRDFNVLHSRLSPVSFRVTRISARNRAH
jgi:hypothetical protein